MIQFRHFTLMRGVRVLIEDATLQIHPGQKIGLTGANGSGKSSLFALLQGELHAESGDVEIPPGWVVAHVAQETPALADSALSFVLDGDQELRAVEHALQLAEQQHQGEQVGELHARLGEIEGYAAPSRAAALLHGLGFADADLQRPVAEFSGGWRVRLNLARALMCRSDLLLLDEPTNHLDLDAVFWLESWLKDYRGTLLLISHDRDFLDAVATSILHIEQQRLTLYRGGYSDFERQRAEKLAQQQSMYQKQQRQMAHLHSYIDRFRAKATKARQAQSRIKALERMELISAAHVDSPFGFSFRNPQAMPDPLLVIDGGEVGYGEKIILHKLELTLRPGERLGLLGRNGAGKSTLVKLLARELTLRQGKRVEGKELSIGYFAQHQLEQLRPQESPLQHMMRLAPEAREQELRDFLGGFDFRGDMAAAPCVNFSGGEKSRLALALLIWLKPNLLLLDEPTNHLDLEMRHALSMALQEFEGGVVMVSHDRAMLRTTCDRFMLVADGKAEIFDGDLEDYRQWLASTDKPSQMAQQKPAQQKNPTLNNSYAQNKADRQARLAERRPLVKEVDSLEKKMLGWQAEKQALELQLADPALYQGASSLQLQTLLKRQGELNGWIESAESRWLELHEQLESIPE